MRQIITWGGSWHKIASARVPTCACEGMSACVACVHIFVVGEHSISKKLPTIMQDLSRGCIATSGQSVSMYPRRPKAEVFSNAVNVVERLRGPTDQVLNARHLRDLHTFSSVMSLILLI